MEKRHEPRAAQAAPVRLKYSSAGDFVRAYTEDVSLGGVGITTHTPVPIGTRVGLFIELGGGKGFNATGEVVWTKPAEGQQPGRLGVRFVELAEAARAWIEQAIRASRDAAGPAPAAAPKAVTQVKGGGELVAAREDLTAVPVSTEQELIVGIDLGTSNSAACVVRNGKPIMIALPVDGEDTTRPTTIPSVVSYDGKGGTLVGRPALLAMPGNEKRTVFGAKRFIGRVYDSPEVQGMVPRFPYKIVPGAGGKVAVDIDGRPVALTAISAKILQAIRERVSKELGRAVTRAIITVPAYYNDNQRDAVVHAGRMAGLQVERILNEPTAAAIAYGLSQAKPRKILVYDLGGGTFDVSIMAVEQGALTVLATGGDTFLGGEDFDATIVDWVSTQHQQKTGQRLSANGAARSRFKLAAEQAKRQLSTRDKAMVTVRDALLLDGSTARVEVELDRASFERMAEPLIARTLSICDLALAQAKVAPSELGDVLLAGGQTRMPAVQRAVEQHFKVKPRCDLNPDEVVALGAGLLASLPKESGPQLKDVLSMAIGVAVDDRFKPIIPRNSPVPAQVSLKISVPLDKFERHAIDLYQGDAAEVRRNEHLGRLKVNAVAAGTEDPVRLRVDFSLTQDCLLKVRLTHLVSGESQEVLLSTRDA